MIGGVGRKGTCRDDDIGNAPLHHHVGDARVEVAVVDDHHLLEVVGQEGGEGVAEGVLDDQRLPAVRQRGLGHHRGEVAAQVGAVTARIRQHPRGRPASAADRATVDARRDLGHRREDLHLVGMARHGRYPRERPEAAEVAAVHLSGHAVEGDCCEPRRPTEGCVGVVGAPTRPVVVGAEVEVLRCVRKHLADHVDAADARTERGVDLGNVHPLARAVVALGGVEADRSRRQHRPDPHARKRRRVAVHNARKGRGRTPRPTKDLHHPVALHEQAGDPAHRPLPRGRRSLLSRQLHPLHRLLQLGQLGRGWRADRGTRALYPRTCLGQLCLLTRTLDVGRALQRKQPLGGRQPAALRQVAARAFGPLVCPLQPRQVGLGHLDDGDVGGERDASVPLDGRRPAQEEGTEGKVVGDPAVEAAHAGTAQHALDRALRQPRKVAVLGLGALRPGRGLRKEHHHDGRPEHKEQRGCAMPRIGCWMESHRA